jgi:hypothetical protein
VCLFEDNRINVSVSLTHSSAGFIFYLGDLFLKRRHRVFHSTFRINLIRAEEWSFHTEHDCQTNPIGPFLEKHDRPKYGCGTGTGIAMFQQDHHASLQYGDHNTVGRYIGELTTS